MVVNQEGNLVLHRGTGGGFLFKASGLQQKVHEDMITPAESV
jgi:hypothetical protein